MLQAVNAKALRYGRLWSSIELSAGVYTYDPNQDETIALAKAAGITVVYPMAYGNTLYGMANFRSPPITAPQLTAYTNWCLNLVARYGTDKMIYEPWNEGNLGPNWDGAPSPTQFATVATHVATAIKTAYPDAVVITGGLGTGQSYPNDVDTFGRNFVANADLTNLDGIGLHPYNTVAPERIITDMASFASSIGWRKPVYMNEHGFSTTWTGGSQQRKAVFAARSVLSGLKTQTPLVIWYDLVSDGTDPGDHESNFGLYDFDFNPLAAASYWGAIVGIANTCVNYETVEYPAQVHKVTFNMGSAQKRVVWNAKLPASDVVHLETVGAYNSLTVKDLLGVDVSHSVNAGVVSVTLAELTGPIVITLT